MIRYAAVAVAVVVDVVVAVIVAVVVAGREIYICATEVEVLDGIASRGVLVWRVEM